MNLKTITFKNWHLDLPEVIIDAGNPKYTIPAQFFLEILVLLNVGENIPTSPKQYQCQDKIEEV